MAVEIEVFDNDIPKGIVIVRSEAKSDEKEHQYVYVRSVRDLNLLICRAW